MQSLQLVNVMGEMVFICRKSHSFVSSSGGIFNVLLWEGQQFRRISVVSQ
jgi:hypothetical protein